MWDARFSDEEYVYGLEPNSFLAESVDRLKPEGRVLSLGAGEGRNEVWLAERGFRILAVDSSSVGLDKLRHLAHRRKVRVETLLADIREFRPEKSAFDAILLVFLHLASADRPALHSRIWHSLAPGGIFLAELFRGEQIMRSSGGPRNPDLLYEREEFERDFPDAEWMILRELKRDLSEGALHMGEACLIQALARKPGG